MENKSSIGGIIATIIIIAVIVLGGLYFWGKRVEESRNEQAIKVMGDTGTTTTQNEASAIKSMNSSDEPSEIDADLKATNTTDLTAELQ